MTYNLEEDVEIVLDAWHKSGQAMKVLKDRLRYVLKSSNAVKELIALEMKIDGE